MTGCSDFFVAPEPSFQITWHSTSDTEFKVQGKTERYAYIIVLHFKSNITIAMHVLQRLFCISGTNDAYVMIDYKYDTCVGVLAICHILSHVNSMSGCWDIQLPFQNVKTLQQLCCSLYLGHR